MCNTQMREIQNPVGKNGPIHCCSPCCRASKDKKRGWNPGKDKQSGTHAQRLIHLSAPMAHRIMGEWAESNILDAMRNSQKYAPYEKKSRS